MIPLDSKYTDEYGEEYPTLEYLKAIEVEDDRNRLLRMIEEGWWCPQWGYLYTHGKNMDFLQLHTAGWSGNESIISALERNKPFWNHMVKEFPGGHYYFQFPKAR